MKRILWGLIKVSVIVGLLVWVAFKFFPENIKEDVPSTEVVTEEVGIEVEEIIKEGEEIVIEEIESIETKEWGVSQRERYASYSAGAGIPDLFTGSLTVTGTALLSTQLAQAFGESINNWENLSVHKKTFWILNELVKQDINVDAIHSLSGITISVQNGEVFVNVSGKFNAPVASAKRIDTTNIASRAISTPTRVRVPLAKHLLQNVDTVVFQTSKRTSAIYWNTVLEMNTVDSKLQKRPVYQDAVSRY